MSAPLLATRPRISTDSVAFPENTNRRDVVTVTQTLLQERDASTNQARRRVLEDNIVVLNLGLADAQAVKFANRGIPVEDLKQVARMALVAATRRFEWAADRSFAGYAVPTIQGEIKRYFRDHGWVVRPPRRVQEGRIALAKASAALEQSLGEAPNLDQLVDATGLTPETVVECRSVDSCFQSLSLEALTSSREDDGHVELRELSEIEGGFADIEWAQTLAPLLARLTDRDRLVLRLRFFEGLSQAEIGERIGVTQMQVSRILARILCGLREGLADDSCPLRS